MKNNIPVYLFVGFLEGGKTHMIQESLEDQRFNSGEKTMLICCEEGIDEYDISRFWGKNVYIENIENEEIRKEIIFQMLKCDNELTLLAEGIFNKYKNEKSLKEYEDD